MIYEYQKVSSHKIDEFMELLNEMGQNGWRVIRSDWEEGFAWAIMERSETINSDLPELDFDDCPF